MCKRGLQGRRTVCLGSVAEAWHLSHLKDVCEAQVGGLVPAPYQAGLMACILLGRPRKAEVCWDVRSGCDTELALDTGRWIWGIVALGQCRHSEV